MDLELKKNKLKLQDLTIVYENIQRIQATLKEIDGFSRPPQDEAETLSLNDIMDSVFQLLKYHHKIKMIEISVQKTDIPCLVQADSKKIEQVFLNIILNAADAILEGIEKGKTVKGLLNIVIEKKDRNVLVCFMDYGIGLDCREVQKIFEPFFSTKRKVEGSGSGLGMTIVKNTVESYGGSIKIFSEKNVGTTVELTFPLAD